MAYRAWNKGLKTGKRPPRSEEWKNNLSKSLKGRTVWNKGVPMSKEQKKKLSDAKREYWNQFERSENYEAIHTHLRRNHKKPKYCWFCGKEGEIQWANLSGFYSRDIDDYRPLCRKCHMARDAREKRRLIRVAKKILKQGGNL